MYLTVDVHAAGIGKGAGLRIIQLCSRKAPGNDPRIAASNENLSVIQECCSEPGAAIIHAAGKNKAPSARNSESRAIAGHSRNRYRNHSRRCSCWNWDHNVCRTPTRHRGRHACKGDRACSLAQSKIRARDRYARAHRTCGRQQARYAGGWKNRETDAIAIYSAGMHNHIPAGGARWNRNLYVGGTPRKCVGRRRPIEHYGATPLGIAKGAAADCQACSHWPRS